MKPKTASPKPAPKESEPRSIASLNDLNQLCRESIEAAVRTPKGVVRIRMRTLTPAESNRIQDLMDEVMPPYLKDKDGAPTDRLDVTDAAYLRRKREVMRKARSLGLYWSVDVMRAGKPGLTDVNEIHEFVSAQATDTVLEQLWTILASDVTPGPALEEGVHFFSQPG